MEFEEDILKNHWATGSPLEYNKSMYRVCRMSYGKYFLEPINWKGGEIDGFSPNTLWLVKNKENKYVLELEEN